MDPARTARRRAASIVAIGALGLQVLGAALTAVSLLPVVAFVSTFLTAVLACAAFFGAFDGFDERLRRPPERR